MAVPGSRPLGVPRALAVPNAALEGVAAAEAVAASSGEGVEVKLPPPSPPPAPGDAVPLLLPVDTRVEDTLPVAPENSEGVGEAVEPPVPL